MKRALNCIGLLLSAAVRGIAVSCTVYVLSAFVFYLHTQRGVWLKGMDMVMVILIGLGFGIPTMIYRARSIPGWVKSLIHMGIGCTMMVLAVLYFMNRVQDEVQITVVKPGPMPVILCYFTIAILIWGGYKLYYRWEAKRINQVIGGKE